MTKGPFSELLMLVIPRLAAILKILRPPKTGEVCAIYVGR